MRRIQFFRLRVHGKCRQTGKFRSKTGALSL
jgi:hypothetical protein